MLFSGDIEGSLQAGAVAPTAYLRVSHTPKNAGLGVGEDESRCQDGAGDSAAPKLENDS